MSDDSDDLGNVAWPGFVDILSSVIIMFVFFVMVVASALYFHIIIFKSKVLSEESVSVSAQSQAKELASTNRSLMQKIKEMDEKMKILEEINEYNEIQLYQQDTQFSESEEQKIEHSPEANSLIIFFGKDSISVTEENQKQLAEIMQEYTNRYGSNFTKVNILAGKNPNALNDAFSRKLSVARMLNVRNTILVSDIPANQVIPVVSDKEDINGSYHWVKITFSKK